MTTSCLLRSLLLCLSLLSVGCASVPGQGMSPQDPFETTNRRVSDFNYSIDRSLLKPVATQYKKAVPELLQESATASALAAEVMNWLDAKHQRPEVIDALEVRFSALHALLCRDTAALALQAIRGVLNA